MSNVKKAKLFYFIGLFIIIFVCLFIYVLSKEKYDYIYLNISNDYNEIEAYFMPLYEENNNSQIITNYEEYDEFISKYNDFPKIDLDFDNYNYILVIASSKGNCGNTPNDHYKNYITNNKVKINLLINSCGVCALSSNIYAIPVDKSINKDSNVELDYEYSYCKDNMYEVKKPIMYIYPTYDTDLSITFNNADNLTHTYPKYNNGWNVHVTTDGNIYDYNTKKNYYALYWEALDNSKVNSDGFVVKGSETIKFLEEKLSLIGLNEREINEFIIYWIDELENNKYNFISFRTTNDINEYMPISFSVKVDTLIRVVMDYIPLDEYIEVNEQKLNSVDRNGFTVVEWGGRKIEKDVLYDN